MKILDDAYKRCREEQRGYSHVHSDRNGETTARTASRFSVFHFIRSVVSFSVSFCGEILFAKVNPTCKTGGSQFLHVLIHFIIRYLRIKLSGGNGRVSHHAADRLYRHTEREGDMGSKLCLA